MIGANPSLAGPHDRHGWLCRAGLQWHTSASVKVGMLVMRGFLGRRSSLAVVAFLVAMAAGLGVAGAAQAAATSTQKVSLTQTNRGCDGAVIGEPANQSFGFAITVKTAHGRLVVAVALKGGPPNTTYNIRLIQLVAGDADCAVVDGTLTTDAEGDGNANVHEATLPGASRVWVDLNNQADFADFFDTRVVSL